MEPCACCETLLDADSIAPCTSLAPLHARLPDPAVESSGGSQTDPAFGLRELSRLSHEDCMTNDCLCPIHDFVNIPNLNADSEYVRTRQNAILKHMSFHNNTSPSVTCVSIWLNGAIRRVTPKQLECIAGQRASLWSERHCLQTTPPPITTLPKHTSSPGKQTCSMAHPGTLKLDFLSKINTGHSKWRPSCASTAQPWF